MRYDRSPATSPQPVATETLQAVLRVDAAEHVADAARLSVAAGRELEDHAGLALLTQTITAVSEEAPASPLSLPVGPVAPGASASVWTIGDDGTETALAASAFYLQTGRHPRIRWTHDAPLLRVKVEYAAGYGADASAVPEDLQQAIADQALAMLDWPALELRKHTGLTPAAARVAARYRGVRL